MSNEQQTTTYRFEFHPYRRPFKHPLTTHHGVWDVREGIILRLKHETGRVGWGEIAPIPWFGSETIEQALDFCRQLPPILTTETIFSIPPELPACQFGFESAWEWREGENISDVKMDVGTRGRGDAQKDFHGFAVNDSSRVSNLNSKIQNLKPKITYSHLLPAGEAVLQSWQTPWTQGSRTFKWKIGVVAIEEELRIFNQLIESLPPSAQLRLDANGGLTQQQAHHWLKAADEVGMVEFLEQPLPPEQFDVMLEMSHQYLTPLALDESVATLDQLEDCYQRGWWGIFVIKAAIAGSPRRLRHFCQNHKIDAVFSSVFESAIARKAVLQLAAELTSPSRAVGFGVHHWFENNPESK
jgi:O-succinylbenzoate synthase